MNTSNKNSMPEESVRNAAPSVTCTSTLPRVAKSAKVENFRNSMRLMTPKQVVAAIGLPRSTVFLKILPKLPFIPPNPETDTTPAKRGRWFREKDVLAWIETNTEGA